MSENLEEISSSFITKQEMQIVRGFIIEINLFPTIYFLVIQTEVIAETTLSKFKNEMKNSQVNLLIFLSLLSLAFFFPLKTKCSFISVQEQNYENLRRETEKLRTEVEKLRSELK